MNRKLVTRSSSALVIALLFLILTTSIQAQDKPFVSRYDAFAGFSYLATPGLNFYQRGFNAEGGVNVRRWVSLGGDFSIFTGSSRIIPRYLTTDKQAALAPLLPMLPPGYHLSVPYEGTTYTYSAGPQFNYRRWKPIMFFIRPALGAMHESVTARPEDPIQRAVVSQLLPSGKKSDTVPFYGVGGGFDLNFSRRFGMRVGIDYVHMHLFDSILKDSKNSVRISVGPTVRWGKSVDK